MMNKLRSTPGARTKLIALAAAFGLAPAAAQAFPTGAATGGTTCGGCHTSTPTPSVGVSISGPSSLAQGESAMYTLTVEALNDGAGFNIATSAGSLGVVDSNTKLMSGQLTHTNSAVSPPTGNLGDWVYNFMVTAPGTLGDITLSAAGLPYVNGDGTGNTTWNTTTFGINVVPEPATALLLGTGLAGLALQGRRRRPL